MAEIILEERKNQGMETERQRNMQNVCKHNSILRKTALNPLIPLKVEKFLNEELSASEKDSATWC
jgi:hypothetical protein